ncbi:MAG TPA: PhnD/SsuA/transferrin family substrate-binding protein [Thermoanaerobaculia bacterium]|nr:PhnD/SsuA/transferrin family substrate-binding protein [Thermoanaerobaculia bacterium]
MHDTILLGAVAYDPKWSRSGKASATTSTSRARRSKHGDTGTSELDVLRALADAGAVGDLTWVQQQAAGHVDPARLEVLYTTPGFDHCMFDALPTLPAAKREAFVRTLFAMSWDNPAHRRLLELEGLREWMPPREEGYQSLIDALAGERAMAAAG